MDSVEDANDRPREEAEQAMSARRGGQNSIKKDLQLGSTAARACRRRGVEESLEDVINW